MSLVSTLAKVALGVAVAKGISSVAKGAGKPAPADPGSGSVFGGPESPQGGNLKDILGGMMSGETGGQAAPAPGGGSLQDMLGQMTGGRSGGGNTGGGLGDLLGQMTGGRSGGSSAGTGGGIGDLLGKVLAGGGAAQRGGASGGGLGGLLEGLSQASQPGDVRGNAPETGSFGDMLNQSFERFGEPDREPSRAQEDAAGLLLRALIQAAKSDGRIDADEKKALVEHLGDVSREEAAFVDAEMKRPVDAKALANDVPRGMAQQIYAMSLMGLDLDSKAEAEYLHELGQALGIEPRMANAIHEKMGEPVLYR